ncbi:MAG: tetratricopeptide repeat protein [Acidobacteria bacterium]|nr:tetratricopeptide repeat protein [Acidobacteriota bacterium]
MDSSRLEKLKAFLEANPDDCFVRYGLAQEYVKQGALEEAIAEFQRILETNPDYQAAYYHAGKTFQKLGRTEQAREVYQKGVETSLRTGDLHARSELEAALGDL